MALPLLPGNSPNKQLGKEGFHKSHHFVYSNGVPLFIGSEKPGIGGELLIGQKVKPNYSVYPKGQGSGLPSWVAFDKQALCFEAYFQEDVPQSRDETYRIRNCKIYFYLEDDTIQVVEPEFKNSGIPQGTLIHRHRVPLPPPNDDQFYNIFHFNINQQMVLYSRTFTVTNCDTFTKNFLLKLGVRLNDPCIVPDDPYSSLRVKMEKSMKPLRPYERHYTLKQFLDHDGKVLRFYCFWDDRCQFGDQRELILLYYLADDTIEILEVTPQNSGRDHVPKFLNRSKLPKNAPTQIKQPGQITERTVLNVFDSSSQEKRYILDNLKTGAVREDFYQDRDLTIGGELNVWGRKVIICDCDEFTKEYYRSKYGIEDFTPGSAPPYSGFGTEEDSLSSCQGLLLKPPQKDFRKFMEKDRCGLESNVLTFCAKMVTTDPVDKDRVFIVSFYLSDDSISVFEPPQRNTGVQGGSFLKRGRVKKPGQELFKSELSEYFTAQDLYVGATLCFNNKNFQILDADEYTFNYMDKHPEEFPRANVGSILSKLHSMPEEKQSEIKTFVGLSDPSNSGFIPFESFRGLLMGLDCGMSEHEVLVLGRRFSDRQQSDLDVGLMLAVAQDFLRKKHFEELPAMAKAFTHQDRHKFADGDEIDYHAFLAGINWVEHPAPPVTPDDILKSFDAGPVAVKSINYSALMEDLFTGASKTIDPTTTYTA
uniref:EF-hand domain (C-terminal) containing 2 n=1 Tax=Sphaeramia orbicularis TaxID=375764 RepID=A0A673C7B2_9TELE